MSGDLEDFLRRAAQRRQAKAAQQQQPPARQRPQYSDSRTERVILPEPEVVDAEVVEEDPNSFAARLRRLEQAKQAAQKAEAEIAKSSRAARSQQSGAAAGPLALSGKPAQDLIAMLRQPGGIQQAILVREVLDRPLHRW